MNGKRVPVFRFTSTSIRRVSKGVETELKVPFGDEWKLTVNYTYNDGRDLSNGGDKPLQTLPFHTANGTLDWKPLDDWSFLRHRQLYRRNSVRSARRANARRLHHV